MSYTLKSEQDIAELKAGGAILARTLDALAASIAPGVTGLELDERARQLLAEANCTPSFLNYAPGGHNPFPAALCVSVNAGLVHGLPNETPFTLGDVVKIDLGLIYRGKYYLDSARTIVLGDISDEAQRLVDVTTESLKRGIAAAHIGNTTGDIGAAVQQHVEGDGFGIVRELVGHGVGFAVHEEPKVPNHGRPGEGIELVPGLVIAIEPMVTLGPPAIMTSGDGWTVETVSGQLSAHVEHTVAITAEGPQILTQI